MKKAKKPAKKMAKPEKKEMSMVSDKKIKDYGKKKKK